jgi:hypothetical protein
MFKNVRMDCSSLNRAGIGENCPLPAGFRGVLSPAPGTSGSCRDPVPVYLYPLKSGKLPDDIGLGQYSHRLLALHNHQPPDLPLFEPADNFKEMDG